MKSLKKAAEGRSELRGVERAGGPAEQEGGVPPNVTRGVSGGPGAEGPREILSHLDWGVHGKGYRYYVLQDSVGVGGVHNAPQYRFYDDSSLLTGLIIL